jgi:hypothetical protein
MIQKFRKKPVVIEAVLWTGNNLDEILDFSPAAYTDYGSGELELKIQTLEGHHIASVGDWIIKGIKGEFYPCKPDIFEQTYEAV